MNIPFIKVMQYKKFFCEQAHVYIYVFVRARVCVDILMVEEKRE